MADREDNVYQAKLAEQAERYDGEYLLMSIAEMVANQPLLGKQEPTEELLSKFPFHDLIPK